MGPIQLQRWEYPIDPCAKQSSGGILYRWPLRCEPSGESHPRPATSSFTIHTPSSCVPATSVNKRRWNKTTCLLHFSVSMRCEAPVHHRNLRHQSLESNNQKLEFVIVSFDIFHPHLHPFKHIPYRMNAAESDTRQSMKCKSVWRHRDDVVTYNNHKKKQQRGKANNITKNE